MKKLLIAIMAIMIYGSAFAGEKITRYCSLIASGIPNAIEIETGIYCGKQPWATEVIHDENGNRLKFDSPIEALNYMGARGWELDQVIITDFRQLHWYNYIIKKQVDVE